MWCLNLVGKSQTTIEVECYPKQKSVMSKTLKPGMEKQCLSMEFKLAENISAILHLPLSYSLDTATDLSVSKLNFIKFILGRMLNLPLSLLL